MTEYKVIIELPAQRDLQGLLRYITDTLKEPVVARRIYISIKEQILTLSQIPLRHNVVKEQPYAAMGVRKLLVENYVAFSIIKQRKMGSVCRRMNLLPCSKNYAYFIILYFCFIWLRVKPRSSWARM